MSRGIDFIGFKNFYHFRLLRKRNIRNMINKINLYKKGKISRNKITEIFQGWSAYANWGNAYKLRKEIKQKLKQKETNN